jgi:DNA invertase Pin-like site-specific DNA recombinase
MDRGHYAGNLLPTPATQIKTSGKIPCPCPDQTLDAQLVWLRGAGCTKIFREKVTGAHSDCRQVLKMLDTVAPGDVVTVTRIDRLARSTFDLFAIVTQIVNAKAQFRSLAEPWADTGTSTGRLMLAVLGGLADVERDLIRTRTAEGRSRAKAQGQQMGRPRRSRRRPPDGARRARRCTNWPGAMASAYPPFAASPLRLAETLFERRDAELEPFETGRGHRGDDADHAERLGEFVGFWLVIPIASAASFAARASSRLSPLYEGLSLSVTLSDFRQSSSVRYS